MKTLSSIGGISLKDTVKNIMKKYVSDKAFSNLLSVGHFYQTIGSCNAFKLMKEVIVTNIQLEKLDIGWMQSCALYHLTINLLVYCDCRDYTFSNAVLYMLIYFRIMSNELMAQFNMKGNK